MKNKNEKEFVSLVDARNAVVLDALRRCGDRRDKTAKLLGISQRTLLKYLADMRDSGIDIERGVAGKPRGENSKLKGKQERYKGKYAEDVIGMATNEERLSCADNPRGLHTNKGKHN